MLQLFGIVLLFYSIYAGIFSVTKGTKALTRGAAGAALVLTWTPFLVPQIVDTQNPDMAPWVLTAWGFFFAAIAMVAWALGHARVEAMQDGE